MRAVVRDGIRRRPGVGGGRGCGEGNAGMVGEVRWASLLRTQRTPQCLPLELREQHSPVIALYTRYMLPSITATDNKYAFNLTSTIRFIC